MKDLIFKDIKVGYIPDTEVIINNKKYLIHNVINGEDISVDTTKKYPELKEVIKKSNHRIDYKPEECGGAHFMHVDYEYELSLKNEYLRNCITNFSNRKVAFKISKH